MTESQSPPSRSLTATFPILPILLVLWLAFLATQAALTANPVQLNLKQLHSAQHLWLATVKDISSGEIDIKQDIKQSESKLKTAKVKSLARSHVKLNQSYLLPVYLVAAGEFEIVPVPVKDQMFYPVYPWTAEVAQRMKTVEPSIQQGIYPELNSSKE